MTASRPPEFPEPADQRDQSLTGDAAKVSRVQPKRERRTLALWFAGAVVVALVIGLLLAG